MTGRSDNDVIYSKCGFKFSLEDKENIIHHLWKYVKLVQISNLNLSIVSINKFVILLKNISKYDSISCML